MKYNAALAAALATAVAADPTWPSSIDELEGIMYQLTSFRARHFADTVSPCSNEASGPGRQNAAEWLRTAFHDMSTANTFFGIGGLDASLQYELNNGENTGTGHRTTIQFMAPYLSPRSSLADLIAMGVYTSVRSCGGPAVPIRAGRVDATTSGNTGVPQPQNSVGTFQQQFERMGFSATEMIQVTACGHTLGGVHSADFPDLVPDGSAPNGEAVLDSTVAVFDNKVVTEYLAGTTKNPLVVGPSVKLDKHSDFKVFNSDGNKTMNALADAQAFQNTCKTVLQKMIDVVPKGVTLTDPIQPYKVKPVDLQLTLADAGANLAFSGYIRVRTTGLAKDSIKGITISYKNRNGAAGSDISATVQGVTQGFDDTFAWFPIQAKVPVGTGISSFVVTVNNADGTSTKYDNNGKEYPLQDTVLFQKPQSCLLPSTGALTLVAAVRNDALANGAKATVSYKVAQDGSPAPAIKTAQVDLTKGQCIGSYTLFTTQYTVPGGKSQEAYVDIANGDKVDSFKAMTDVGGSCNDFGNAIQCGAVDPPANSTTVSSTSMPITTSSSVPASTTSASSTAIPTPTHIATLGGYKMVSCWTEGVGARALSGAAFANDTMTNEKCMDLCKGYVYWGTEYGRECYCGNSLASSSGAAPIDQCNMVCGGNPAEYCGAGSRLELYSTTAVQPTTTGTLAHKPTVAPYTMVGCWTEGAGVRALDKAATSAANMTNEACATFCKNYRYFGTEYGSECYCGSYLADSSKAAPIAECNMPCGGDQFEYCGAANRLELYMDKDINGGVPEQPAAIGNFVLVGCQTEGNGTRALADASIAQDNMTNEGCGNYCKDYTYFGTEYGRECYCGNFLANSSLVADKSECKITCAGSNLEYCGGSSRLSLYKKKPAVPPPASTSSSTPPAGTPTTKPPARRRRN
ncbi:Putative Carbohydrate-binding WSC [[Torrubiella] hemipterigena]|uniref:Putative Carbohydrate-binding WSC n=1 Tax=[Torrubiella] hemipterigena TaxID=1531966 RepID=A0A0A1T6Z8_9HYPO|nr:Putative Carbohydrate-binding WSC [[Torrubiella] hemipterigena]